MPIQDYKKVFEDKGYKIFKNISSNNRFESYVLKKGDSYFFSKVAIADLKREVENEAWFNLTFNRLNNAYPNLKARCPKIIELGVGWLICEYFDGPKLAEKLHVTKEQISGFSEEIVQILVDLDDTLVVKSHPEPSFQNTNSAPYTNLIKKIDQWMEKPLLEGIITQEKINKTKSLITKYQQYTKPALAHGDFVPWHMFRLEDGNLGLVDGEHGDLTKPRYYDLAYIYTRLFTWVYAEEESAQLLKSFLDKTKPNLEEFRKSFLPVVTLRAIGMHIDALNDLGVKDYKESAQRLLNKCLLESLDPLIK